MKSVNKAPGVQVPDAASRGFMSWGSLVLAATLFVAGLIVGRVNAEPSSAAAVGEANGDEAGRRFRPRKQRIRREATGADYFVRPAELYVASDTAAEQRYTERQAHELMQLFYSELERAELVEPEVPEAAANRLDEYLRGMTDAVLRAAPELTASLNAEVEARLCDSATSAGQHLVLSKLIRAIPELASEKGFECVFSQRPEEGVVLWAMLDALDSSELSRPPALAAIERAAVDPRTKQRFLSREAQIELRGREPSAELSGSHERDANPE